MQIDIKQERGTSLIEAVVAASLLVTIVAGTASLTVLARRLGAQTELGVAATLAASGRLQALRAVPFGYDLLGGAPDVPALAYTSLDALDQNTPGFWDALDESGQPVVAAAEGAPTFVRRWAIWPVSLGSGEARAVEVCVFAWPAPAGAPPLTCLAAVRTRQP